MLLASVNFTERVHIVQYQKGMSFALIPKDLLRRLPSESKFATNSKRRDIPSQSSQLIILLVQRRSGHTLKSLLRFAPSTPRAHGTTRSRRSQAKQLAQGSIKSSATRLNGDYSRPSYPTVVLEARNNINKFENCVVLTRVGSFYEVSDPHTSLNDILTPISCTSSKPSNMRRHSTSSLRRRGLWQDQLAW